MAGEYEDDDDTEMPDKDDMGQMEIGETSATHHRLSENNKLVKNIGKVVRDLRNLGFTSMTDDAYASAIFLLLKVELRFPFRSFSFQVHGQLFLMQVYGITSFLSLKDIFNFWPLIFSIYMAD